MADKSVRHPTNEDQPSMDDSKPIERLFSVLDRISTT